MTSLSRKLREQPTAAEKALWRLLYPFRTGAFHFRKQAPIGPYIADFACHHARLVIEVDGDTHDMPGARERDAKRDVFLRGEGYSVVRFTNADVLKNPEGVLKIIEAKLQERAQNQRTGRSSPKQSLNCQTKAPNS